jgi:murein tripeptide amidase MpaA
MDFAHYFPNEELEQVLQDWAQAYPGLVNLQKIGESYQKRSLWLLALTNKDTGPDGDKPAVWLDANIHAIELTGTTVTLNIANHLLEDYGKDERITHLLDTSAYYIMPRINPDGAALAMAATPHFVRSGVRPYPYNEKQDGLHEQDMDGDGRILQMRLPDSNGDWKISTLDPRLMEKRRLDDQGGSYYRLFSEGRLENFDGWTIKEAPPLEGLDFNRNFPFEWRPEGAQPGAGPFPVSEAEIRALVDFISHHPNINLGVSYHTFSGVILRPYSTKPDDQMDVNDLWVYKSIAQRGTELTGYRNASVFHDFLYHPKEVTTGAFDDWMYDHMGAFTFTIELWDLPTAAGIKDRKFSEWFRDHPHEQDLQILKWVDEHAPGKYVPWYPFNHPQLGQVELGGWDVLFTWGNPPPEQLEAEVARNLPFALALGDLLPRLSIRELTATRLEENTGADGLCRYHINLVLENTGYLPTSTSQQGKNRAAMRPIQVDLELGDGMELVQGKRRSEYGHLEGRSNKFTVAQVWGSSPTDNRLRIEWVIKAAPATGLAVKIQCPRGGKLTRKLVFQ